MVRMVCLVYHSLRVFHARGLFVGSCLVAAVAVTAACPPTDVLYDGVDAGHVVDAAGCTHADIPDPPNIPDDGDLSVLFALRSLTLTPDSGPPLGYDLDGVCTCNQTGANAACTLPQNGVRVCHDQGRDTADLDLVSALFPTIYDGFNTSIAGGVGTTLFEISGWNGKPDDQSIILKLYLSNGTWATTDAGTLVDGGSIVPPRWDGTDRWTVDSISGAPGQELFAKQGFVRDGFAIVKTDTLNGVLLPLERGAQLDIQDVRLVGRIVDVGGHREIHDGQIDGRMSAAQLLRTYSCAGANALDFGVIKSAICTARDVMTFKNLDNTGHPCDALSYAVGFIAVEAQRGPLHEGFPGCDASLDDCSP